jgi:hypothetical protein
VNHFDSNVAQLFLTGMDGCPKHGGKIGAYLCSELTFEGSKKRAQKASLAQWQNRTYPHQKAGMQAIPNESELKQQMHYSSRTTRSFPNDQRETHSSSNIVAPTFEIVEPSQKYPLTLKNLGQLTFKLSH